MDVRDLRETALRLERAFSELEWRMDWLVLDRDAFDPDEVRAVAVELRLACMGHTAALSEQLEVCRQQRLEGDAVEKTAAAMSAVFDGLVQLRIQLDRFEMSGRTGQLERAYYDFAARLRALLDAEAALGKTEPPRRRVPV